MPLQLPTDTQHFRLETRQYELFHRPLGQGISRRKMLIGLAVTMTWALLLALVHVSPLGTIGPALYLVPPVGAVIFATRVGDDGRMVLMRWYDAVWARAPRRRAVITNPLMSEVSASARTALTLRVTTTLAGPRRPSSRRQARKQARKQAAS